jgi:hypothetical protein
MRRGLVAAVVSTLALGVALGGHASAAAPIKVSNPVDFTTLAPFTSATCGFDVYQHLVGTFTATAITKSGAVVKEIDGAHHARLTWFAPSRGTSYSYPLNSPVKYYYPQGATLGAPAIFTIYGLSEKVPGAPAAAGPAVFNGVVVDFSPDGIPLVITDPEPVKIRGSGGPTVQDRCAALA